MQLRSKCRRSHRLTYTIHDTVQRGGTYHWLRECRSAEHTVRRFRVGETFRHFNYDKRTIVCHASCTAITISFALCFSPSTAAMRPPGVQSIGWGSLTYNTAQRLLLLLLLYLSCVRTAQWHSASTSNESTRHSRFLHVATKEVKRWQLLTRRTTACRPRYRPMLSTFLTCS